MANIRPTEDEVKAAVEEANRKCRIFRLQQVRAQAKQLSLDTLARVNLAKSREVAKIKENVRGELERENEEVRCAMENHLIEATNRIGAAHLAAAMQQQADLDDLEDKKEQQKRADERGRRAILAQREEDRNQQQKNSHNLHQKRKAYETEKLRSQRVANLPTPQAIRKKRQQQPVKPSPPAVVVHEVGTMVTSRYKHPTDVVKRITVSEEQNAKEAAEKERKELEEEREREEERKAELERRVEERGRLAKEREKRRVLGEKLVSRLQGDDLLAYLRGEDITHIEDTRERSHQPHQCFDEKDSSAPATFLSSDEDTLREVSERRSKSKTTDLRGELLRQRVSEMLSYAKDESSEVSSDEYSSLLKEVALSQATDSSSSVDLNCVQSLKEADELLEMVQRLRSERVAVSEAVGVESREEEHGERREENRAVDDPKSTTENRRFMEDGGGRFDARDIQSFRDRTPGGTTEETLHSGGVTSESNARDISESNARDISEPSSSQTSSYQGEELRVRVVYESREEEEEGSVNGSSKIFRREMKEYLGMPLDSTTEFYSPPSTSPVNIQDTIDQKLTTIKNNREKIQTELSKLKSERVGKFSSTDGVQRTSNYVNELNTIEDNRMQSSTPLQHMESELKSSEDCFNTKESSLVGHIHPIISTPVRMYTENVKQDGTGRRPIRRKEKFEMQKQVLLQSYIQKLLARNPKEICRSSSSGSGTSSSIEISSSGLMDRLAKMMSDGSLSEASNSTSGNTYQSLSSLEDASAVKSMVDDNNSRQFAPKMSNFDSISLSSTTVPSLPSSSTPTVVSSCLQYPPSAKVSPITLPSTPEEVECLDHSDKSVQVQLSNQSVGRNVTDSAKELELLMAKQYQQLELLEDQRDANKLVDGNKNPLGANFQQSEGSLHVDSSDSNITDDCRQSECLESQIERTSKISQSSSGKSISYPGESRRLPPSSIQLTQYSMNENSNSFHPIDGKEQSFIPDPKNKSITDSSIANQNESFKQILGMLDLSKLTDNFFSVTSSERNNEDSNGNKFEESNVADTSSRSLGSLNCRTTSREERGSDSSVMAESDIMERQMRLQSNLRRLDEMMKERGDREEQSSSSSTSVNLEEALKGCVWTRGMLSKMNRLEEKLLSTETEE